MDPFRPGLRAALLGALFLALPFSALCQPPKTQKPAAAPSDSGSPKGITPLDIGGILGGIAAVIGALYNGKQIRDFKKDFVNQLVTPETLRLIKNEGHFLDDQDLTALGRVLRDLLMKDENLKVIRLHGGFVDKDLLNQLGDEFKKHSDRLREAEQTLLDLEDGVTRLKITIDHQEERRKLLEDVQKRFPQLRPEGGE